MNRLLIADWEIFAVIVSNKDSKFLSEFWNIIFRKLNIFLLTSIVYYAQTNDQFERSNQTVQIAIRFFTSNNSKISIVSTLFIIQSQFNNNFNAFIEFASNEIIYDFKVRDIISTFNQRNLSKEWTTNKRKKYQAEANDAIAFANVKMKIYYDFKHKSLLLKSKKKTYFRLNKDYKLFDHHKKLSQQKCEFFLIKKRVNRLTYELKLSSTWNIHSVISIAQLESTSSTQDSYNKFRFHYSNAMKIEENTEHEKFYEVKQIFVKRIRKYDRIAITQYRIKWFEYEPEFNKWKSLFFLNNCLNLIEKFEQKHRNAQASQWFLDTQLLYWLWSISISLRTSKSNLSHFLFQQVKTFYSLFILITSYHLLFKKMFYFFSVIVSSFSIFFSLSFQSISHLSIISFHSI